MNFSEFRYQKGLEGEKKLWYCLSRNNIKFERTAQEEVPTNHQNFPDITVFHSCGESFIEAKITPYISKNSFDFCFNMSQTEKVSLVICQNGLWLIDIRDLIHSRLRTPKRKNRGSREPYYEIYVTKNKFTNIENFSQSELLKILGENK